MDKSGNQLIKSLITDRTAADVASRNEKGTYNASDLNRVDMVVDFLSECLIEIGYSPKTIPAVGWSVGDWYDPTTADRYLSDIAEIRKQLAVLPSTPDVPTDMENFTFSEANDIEQILKDVFRQYELLLSTRVACGEALCGGDYF